MNYFQGKKVFITGGSSGIGREAAAVLAASGASVAIFGRDPARLESARARIESKRLSPACLITAMQMDVSDHGDVEAKIPSAVREFGVPDILINSAGVGHADYFEDISYKKFDEVLKTNLYGTRNVTASLVPFMKDKGGHIVNVSSMLGLIGLFGYSAYCSSKFALIGFSECLRSELRRYGIRVSVFCPPEVDTPMTDYMANSSPCETRALVKMNGLMSVERAARLMLAGIEKKRFLIIPGMLSKSSYVNKILNPPLTRLVLDAVVSIAGRMKKTR